MRTRKIVRRILANGTNNPPIPISESMQPLFGTALNNVGFYYNEFTNNSDWNNFIETVKFQHGAYTVGAESRWIHYISQEGGFNLIPENTPLSTITPPVGMRANTNEIYYFTNSLSGATNLQGRYNDTGVDFFDVTIDYVQNHNQFFIFTANVCHGSTTELGQYLQDLTSANLDFKVRYDNEVSTGVSGSTPGSTLTSSQYITLCMTFDDYMQTNYPEIPRVINAADHSTGNSVTGWRNEDIASFAKSRNIEEFSQYLWLGDNAGNVPTANTNLNIDNYFTLALENTRDSILTGNNSLYGEVLPRIQVYYNQFYPVKFHVGQYGCSLQRTGYVANTMLHGLMIGNELFEIFKFNYTHNNFISSAIFLENESAVDEKRAQDNLFNIDPSLEVVSGSTTFVKRIQGIVYELFQPLSTYSVGYPEFVPITVNNINISTDKLDAVSFVVGSEVYIWVYNILNSKTLLSIEVDNVVLGTNIDKTGAYSTELYGSVGSSPAYDHFKDYPVENPGFVPVDVLLVSNSNVSSSNVSVPEHSILKIKLLGISSATSITLNF
jgi:hypothetical protein